MSHPICIPLATVDQLRQLENIGAVRAASIVKFREDNMFPTVSDLAAVSEIAESVWLTWIQKKIVTLSFSEEILDDPDYSSQLYKTFWDLFHRRESDLQSAQMMIDKVTKENSDLALALKDTKSELLAANKKAISLSNTAELCRIKNNDLAAQLRVTKADLESAEENLRRLATETDVMDMQNRLRELGEELEAQSSLHANRLQKELEKQQLDCEDKLVLAKCEYEKESQKLSRQITRLEKDLEWERQTRKEERERYRQNIAEISKGRSSVDEDYPARSSGSLAGSVDSVKGGRDVREADDFQQVYKVFPPDGRYSRRGHGVRGHSFSFATRSVDDRVYASNQGQFMVPGYAAPNPVPGFVEPNVSSITGSHTFHSGFLGNPAPYMDDQSKLHEPSAMSFREQSHLLHGRTSGLVDNSVPSRGRGINLQSRTYLPAGSVGDYGARSSLVDPEGPSAGISRPDFLAQPEVREHSISLDQGGSRALKRSKKRPKHRSPSTSSTESSESSSESESSDDINNDQHHRRRRHRSRSPPLPKMSTFDGEGKSLWESFIFQFERIADRQGWRSSKKLDRLIDCLSGAALQYANKLDVGRNYKKLKLELKHRFSSKEAPVAARRQLQFVKQREDESLEQFSQRVHFLALDGYPLAEKRTVQQISVEAFLRGSREKDAARTAMEKNPKDIYKALKYLKASVANQRAIFGTRSYGYPQRQVSFADLQEENVSSGLFHRPLSLADPVVEGGEGDTRSAKVDANLKSAERCPEASSKTSSESSDIIDADLIRFMAMLRRRFPRSRSPTPPRLRSPSRWDNIECFKCRQKGHIERNCPVEKAEVFGEAVKGTSQEKGN